MTFTEYPVGTVITDQYAALGVVFTDGDDLIDEDPVFKNDTYGLCPGAIDQFRMEFDQPMRSLAIDFPGTVRFKLYYEGRLVFNHVAGGAGAGFFVGLAGPPFDVAVLTDPFGLVLMDDLHFGTGPLTGDVNFDGLVNVDDLVQVILDWGACDEACCPADTDFDGDVDVDDLVAVITNWT